MVGQGTHNVTLRRGQGQRLGGGNTAGREWQAKDRRMTPTTLISDWGHMWLPKTILPVVTPLGSTKRPVPAPFTTLEERTVQPLYVPGLPLGVTTHARVSHLAKR